MKKLITEDVAKQFAKLGNYKLSEKFLKESVVKEERDEDEEVPPEETSEELPPAEETPVDTDVVPDTGVEGGAIPEVDVEGLVDAIATAIEQETGVKVEVEPGDVHDAEAEAGEEFHEPEEAVEVPEETPPVEDEEEKELDEAIAEAKACKMEEGEIQKLEEAKKVLKKLKESKKVTRKPSDKLLEAVVRRVARRLKKEILAEQKKNKK